MTDPHQDLRDAIRALCATFPPEYHRRIDEERGYPEEFVEALTKAGWLAALIPEDYGGSGLGLTEADIAGGLYDGAAVETWLVDWTDTPVPRLRPVAYAVSPEER